MSHHASLPKSASSPDPAASAKVILADDFSTEKTGWTDDAHAAAGTYTGTAPTASA